MTDKQIIKLFFDRNEDAIGELEKSHGRALISYAKKCLSDRRDAEEVYVDALSDVWNSIPPENPRVLCAYAMTVLKRRVFDKVRYTTRECRDRSREIYLDFDGDAVTFGSSESAEDTVVNSQGGEIEAFLRIEGNKNRVIFVKRYYFGESVSDIAKDMGLSENAVSMRLLRTRERLYRYLKERGVIN